MTLPIVNLPPEEPPEFRPVGPVAPPLPPIMPHPELAPFLPPQHPGWAERLLTPFAGLRVAGPIGNRDAAPFLLAALLSGLGSGMQRRSQQREGDRQELNRRFASDAAERNRENLRASRDAEERRLSRLHGESDRIATEKRAEERRVKQRAEDESNVHLTAAEARELNLPLSATLVPKSELPKDVLNRLPPKRPAAPRAPKIGPVLPTVAAIYRDLKNRSQDARMYTPAVADSLDGLANVVDLIHAQIREAQSPEEVDGIDVPDGLPPDVTQALAKAARTRKAQLGKLGDLQQAHPDTLGDLEARHFPAAASSLSAQPRQAPARTFEKGPILTDPGYQYEGAPDLPVKSEGLGPLELATLAYGGPAGPAGGLAGRAMVDATKRFAGGALREAVARGAAGAATYTGLSGLTRLGEEGNTPLVDVPAAAVAGGLMGPAVEGVGPLVGRGWRAMNRGLAREGGAAVTPTTATLGGVGEAPAARPAPVAAPAPEPPGIATRRPESGGEAERILRPEKIGLPAGEDAERRVINAFHGAGLDTRKIRTFGDMKAAAQDLGLTLDDLLRAPQRRPLADAEVVALRNAINAQASVAQQASEKLRLGGLTAAEERQTAAMEELAQRRIIDALKRLSVGGTETGRAVAAFRIIGQRTLDPAYWYRSATTQLRGREFTPEIRQAIDNLIQTEDRVGLARLMASLHRSTATEKAISLWKAGLLSNPATDVANINGNVFMAQMETLKDIPATVIDMLASLATGQRTKTFSPIVLKEKVGGILPGLRKAGQFLKQGDLEEDLLTKYDYNHETRFDSPILQTYTQMVFRRLGAEDVLFREPALRASVAEQAVIQAKNAGLTGRAFLERVRQLIKAPSESMLQIAQSDADYATFQSKSPLASWLGSARGGWQPVVEGIAPFRRTPINISNAILDYSPFGVPKAIIGSWNRRGMDKYLRQKYVVETLGRSVTGTTLAALGWKMAEQGLAVGLPPKEERLRNNRRNQGVPNNSVQFNGRWVTLDRIAPASNIFLLGVNAYEQFQRNPSLAGKIGGTAGAGVATLREQTFLKGVSGLGKAIDQPETMGGNFIAQLGASVIPSLVGAVARGTDPAQREQEGLAQGLQARIPGARGLLPPVIDVRGREVPAPKGLAASLLSPVTATPKQDDVVARAFASSGYGPGSPEPTLELHGKKVKLAGEEKTQFLREMGQALDEAMRRVASDPSFARAEPDEQRKRLTRAVEDMQTPIRNRWKARKLMPPAGGQGGTR